MKVQLVILLVQNRSLDACVPLEKPELDVMSMLVTIEIIL